MRKTSKCKETVLRDKRLIDKEISMIEEAAKNIIPERMLNQC